ncbi:MAG: MFS transporter [Microthrixaceae bacterium]
MDATEPAVVAPDRRVGPGALAPLVGTFVLLGLFMGGWAVMTPEIEAALDGGPGRLGLVLSGALLVAAGANVAGGALTERWGTTRALTAFLALWALTLLIGAVAPAPWGVAAAVVLVLSAVGAVDVVANVAGTAALADRPGHLVRLHATFNLGAAGGAALVAVALALLAAAGWRWWWVAVAVLVTVGAVAWRGRHLPAGHPGEHVGLLDGLRTLRRERLMGVALAFSLGAMVEGGIGTWGVLHLRGRLDAGLLVGAGGAVLGALVAAGARLAAGGVQSAASARRVLVGGALVAAAGLAVLAAASSPVAAAAGLVAAAGGVSVCWPLLMAEVGRGRARPGVVVGAVTAVGYLGVVLGPGLVGLVAGRWGVASGLWMLAGAAALIPVCLGIGRGVRPAG